MWGTSHHQILQRSCNVTSTFANVSLEILQIYFNKYVFFSNYQYHYAQTIDMCIFLGSLSRIRYLVCTT